MIQEARQTFTNAVDLEFEVPTAGIIAFVAIHFSAAPTTAENIHILFNSRHGTDYDTVLHQLDPSDDSLTDFIWYPDGALTLNRGDTLHVTYPNTDGNTLGVTIKGLDSSQF